MLYAPERILVAPSGFKESLSAIEVADAIAAGIRRVLPGSRVDTFPVPDGGEGTVDILAQRQGAVTHTETVMGPVGKKVQATWLSSRSLAWVSWKWHPARVWPWCPAICATQVPPPRMALVSSSTS